MSNQNTEIIKSDKDILIMLDSIIRNDDNKWWDNFYSDKNKPVPFFCNLPDESLNEYIQKKKICFGKALDIGCGNGRNSIFLAKNGFNVHGIDFSSESIKWAKKNAHKDSVEINFECNSIFETELEPVGYDYINDSGCLHHIKPHRRQEYLIIVWNALKDSGNFGLVCFNPKGGANISDYDVYRERSMKGGLAFTKEKLETILKPYFKIIEIREMKEINNGELFGKDFLWTMLLKKVK